MVNASKNVTGTMQHSDMLFLGKNVGQSSLPNIKYSEHHVYFEISQYHTSGSTFSSSLSKQVAASSDYSDSRLGTQPNALLPVFVLADPTSPLASCARARPKGLGHGFCSQNLVVWNSL